MAETLDAALPNSVQDKADKVLQLAIEFVHEHPDPKKLVART